MCRLPGLERGQSRDEIEVGIAGPAVEVLSCQ
jgi:hypothetical protein